MLQRYTWTMLRVRQLAKLQQQEKSTYITLRRRKGWRKDEQQHPIR